MIYFSLFSAILLTTFIGRITSSDENYRLFATKTTYENAINYRDKINFDNEFSSFGQNSLEDEHSDLIHQECKPITFYLFSRHAARYPSKNQIKNINEDLNEIKHQLKKKKNVPNELKDILTWKSKMVKEQYELITGLGDYQTRNIAARFKKLYPDILSKSKIVRIGVTERIRTSETLIAFLKKVDNAHINHCDFNHIPTNEASSSNYSVEKIRDDVCYQELSENYIVPFIEFHRTCPTKHHDDKSKKVRNQLVDMIAKSKVFSVIAEKLAKRLDLKFIDEDTAESIYQMCRFEIAIQNESIWCKLFDKRDLIAYEFKEDVTDYTKRAYDPNRNDKQVCPMMKDLIGAFNKGVSKSTETLLSYYYFGHEGAIKRLMPIFSIFRDDKTYNQQVVGEFIKIYENKSSKQKFEMSNQFRTSWLVPFGANYAFVQYKCPNNNFKILAALNERPIKMGGCNGQVQCSFSDFLSAYSVDDCKLEEICD